MNMKRFVQASFGAAMAIAAFSPAQAVPVQWTVGSGGNGHYYELVQSSSGLEWTAARSAALASTHLGQSGYLATVTSAAEQTFLNALNPNDLDAWLGGSDQGTEGVWLWMDGPEAGTQFWQGGPGGSATAPFNYANWVAGVEPNDFSTGEDGLVGWWNGDQWNDLPHTGYFLVSYYVVEYSAPTSVAEPAALGLFGLGLVGLGLAKRRRRTR